MSATATLSGPLCTRPSLAHEFAALGINAGDTVLLHSSLRSLGWVCGGAEAVILALLDVLGDQGTLVVPTHSADNSDPAAWSNPPVPEQWFNQIRDHTPAYNPRTTKTRLMGAIPEMLRTWPGTLRSGHPQTSFAALGPLAAAITSNHALDCQLGEQSPLARLEEVKARVLLLGVGFDKCTTFHLAEHRVPGSNFNNSFAIDRGQGREWITVQDRCVSDDNFKEIGANFERDAQVLCGKVGAADARLFSLVDAIAYARDWMLREQAGKLEETSLS